MEKRRRRSSRSRSSSALRMSSPSSMTSPAVGSIRRVMQRTRVDLPLPDRPITTKTSPGLTSNDTSRIAIIEPVLALSSSREQVDVRRADDLVLGRPEDLPQVLDRDRRRRGVPVWPGGDVHGSRRDLGHAAFLPAMRSGSSVAVRVDHDIDGSRIVRRPVARWKACGDVQSLNQPDGPGAVFCQMCLASRYSSRPVIPSSRPIPDCLKPPHSACGR